MRFTILIIYFFLNREKYPVNLFRKDNLYHSQLEIDIPDIYKIDSDNHLPKKTHNIVKNYRPQKVSIKKFHVL